MSYLKNGTLLRSGTYRIVRFIASGGFGCTYEAVHTGFNDRVAIKEFFIKSFCNRDETTSRVAIGTEGSRPLVERLKGKFLEEARALRQFRHPSIVGVIDVFEENGTAYYVMDYVEGQSLSSVVEKQGPISEEQAVRYISQVAGALDYVHAKRRLHLDVKPANILINGDNAAILIDFGASKQYDEAGGENTSMLPCKTRGYAPPEQMNNSVRRFTPCTDIYALGATLYKCLTGLTPPDASDRIAGEELKPVPASSRVRDAIAAAMALNKNQRPQCIAEFLYLLSLDTIEAEVVEDVVVIDDLAQREEVHRDVVIFTDANGNKTYIIKGVEFKMIKVEGGTFQMGREPERPKESKKRLSLWSLLKKRKKEVINKFDLEPVHSVTLSDYYIGETVVTQALWKSVMGSNPSRHQGDNKPVESVDYCDCKKFIDKLNELTGQQFRLPTEAEWEFAARGGNKSKHYKYSGSDSIDYVAWYNFNSQYVLHDVKTKYPNELGLYDMSGNVNEWCSDWFCIYSGCAETNPKGPSWGCDFVIRGGSWRWEESYCQVSSRSSEGPHEDNTDLGLRLAQ